MAKTNTFSCSVITPERKLLEVDAKFVAFPAHDGEIGVLTDRAPLVCKLGIGPLRIETADPRRDGEGADKSAEPSRDRGGAGKATQLLFYIDGGFAEVLHNQLTILTERAGKPEDIDPEAAKQSLVEARAMKITDQASFDARSNAIKRAEVQIKLSKSRG